MAMGTTTHQPPNQPMQPAPTSKDAPGPHMDPPKPGAAGAQDVSKPFLPEDFDKVMLLRMYPDAKSVDELRSRAMEAGAAVLKMAEESRASVDVPVPELDPEGKPIPPAPPAPETKK